MSYSTSSKCDNKEISPAKQIYYMKRPKFSREIIIRYDLLAWHQKEVVLYVDKAILIIDCYFNHFQLAQCMVDVVL